MPRAAGSRTSRRRHRKYIKLASGYRGGRHRLYKSARMAVDHAGVYAYRDRKVRKREFRKLWIARINAAARACGLNYSRFMRGLKLANIDVNRKMLAHIAATDEDAFTQLVEIAKSKLPTSS